MRTSENCFVTERGKKRKPKFKPRPLCLGKKEKWITVSYLGENIFDLTLELLEDLRTPSASLFPFSLHRKHKKGASRIHFCCVKLLFSYLLVLALHTTFLLHRYIRSKEIILCGRQSETTCPTML